MSNIERRIERAEELLGLDQGPTIITRVWFGDGPVPPEERRDNFIIRHVPYEAIQAQRQGGAGHEP